jgi:hypothetical protein
MNFWICFCPYFKKENMTEVRSSLWTKSSVLVSQSPYMRTETTLLECLTIGKVLKPSNSDGCTPSSESCRVYMSVSVALQEFRWPGFISLHKVDAYNLRRLDRLKRYIDSCFISQYNSSFRQAPVPPPRPQWLYPWCREIILWMLQFPAETEQNRLSISRLVAHLEPWDVTYRSGHCNGLL